MRLIDKLFGKVNNKKVTSKIIERNSYRIRESIQTWRDALTLAEMKVSPDSTIKPDRRSLLRIYNEIMLDTHLQSVIDLRKEKVLEYPFNLYTDNGKIDEESTKKLKSEWFYKLLSYVIDSVFYGHSLIQIDAIYKDNIEQITLIDRINVIPETGEYMPDIYNNMNSISYLDSKTYDWLFEFYKERDDLGLLKGIAPLVLWKRSTMSAWAEYTEIFGMPIRIAKTTSNVAADRTRLANFVRDLGKSAWAVLDDEETIEFIENKKSDAFNVYDKFIDKINKEISKAVLGVTQINEDGSSYSQSKVHSDQSEIKTASDLRNIEFIIKDKVLPKLVKLGVLPENLIFQFDRSTVLKIEDQILVDEKLNLMYPLQKDYLKERYNVEFEDITFEIEDNE